MPDETTGVTGLADATLVELASGGDVEARAEILARHLTAAERLASVVCGDQPSAAVGAGAAGGVGERAVLAAVSSSGSEAVPSLRPVVLASVLAEAAADGSAADASGTAAPLWPALTKLVAGLPDMAKAVLWHRDVEDDSADVTARLLGVPVDAVAVLLAEARETVQAEVLLARGPGDGSASCRWTYGLLHRAVSAPVERRARVLLGRHVDACSFCRWTMRHLETARAELPRLLAAALLGGAGAGYLGVRAALPRSVGGPASLPLAGGWRRGFGFPAPGLLA